MAKFINILVSSASLLVHDDHIISYHEVDIYILRVLIRDNEGNEKSLGEEESCFAISYYPPVPVPYFSTLSSPLTTLPT